MKKRAFTLFEMLLVITLISLAVGGITFTFLKASKHEEFEGSVKAVISKLGLAQRLSQTLETDISLKLVQTSQGIEIEFLDARVFSEDFLKALNKKKSLKRISECEWKGNTSLLTFSPSSRRASKGVLTLKGEEKSVDIVLKGDLRRIVKNEEYETEIKATYPEEALSFN